jgi:predicted RNase H-like HicB family nuclease
MKLKVIVHEAETGGYQAEVPAIPGCATQGDTFEQLVENLYEILENSLPVNQVNIDAIEAANKFEVMVIEI